MDPAYRGVWSMSPLQRVNDSVLGALERPALAWMAVRLPAAVVPDHLTAFGAVGAVLTAAGYVLSRRSLSWLWLACAGLFINWLGDSLDGTLARLRHIERPRYGFFIDHTSDSVLPDHHVHVVGRLAARAFRCSLPRTDRFSYRLRLHADHRADARRDAHHLFSFWSHRNSRHYYCSAIS